MAGDAEEYSKLETAYKRYRLRRAEGRGNAPWKPWTLVLQSHLG